jgi:hypothetical protein
MPFGRRIAPERGKDEQAIAILPDSPIPVKRGQTDYSAFGELRHF